MIIEYISKNLKTILVISWFTFFFIMFIVMRKNIEKNNKSERKHLILFLLLLVISVVMILFQSGFIFKSVSLEGFKITENKYFWLVIFLILFSALFTISKLHKKTVMLSRQIEKLDQRYSIGKNHAEYQKRKNSSVKYRSQ